MLDFQQFNELTSSVINDGININSSYQNSLALSWDQIIELAKHPLCTIGGHTVNHLSLKNQSEEDALNEISINKQEIEDHIKQPITHFAVIISNIFKQEYTRTCHFNFVWA